MDVPVDDLVRVFGKTLIGTFRKWHGSYFDNAKDSLEFLSGIETVIHSDVRKLYPDARLPGFDCHWEGEDTLVMKYASNRPMATLAAGAIEGAIEYYKDNVTVEVSDGPTNDAHSAVFTLTRVKD